MYMNVSVGVYEYGVECQHTYTHQHPVVRNFAAKGDAQCFAFARMQKCVVKEI
jgi:hypothetical protein